MEITKEQAIQKLQYNISIMQNQIDIIDSINLSKPVSEDKWHEICETPLRSSDLLCIILKNIFPDAENIKCHCNYVYFNLYGFKCGIPTSRVTGVMVDLSWYEKDNGEPKEKYKYVNVSFHMKKYFDALDNKESWETLFKYRFPRLGAKKKYVKFLLWFLYYKWKDPHRQEWEKKFKENEIQFDESVIKYHEKRKEMQIKIDDFFYKLIPELNKFTNKINNFESNNYKFEEIKEYEKK